MKMSQTKTEERSKEEVEYDYFLLKSENKIRAFFLRLLQE